MRHHACAAAIGLLAAAILAPGSQSHAASADPIGYWVKPDAERESKIHIFKCGKNLCAKIAWLKEPNDRKGKPLHDVRNQNPSQRGRPIMGLPIFTGLVPSGPSTWNGKIYNPEDGQTYTATLTVVSRKQIQLKGCKAWLLCGERQWFRTTPPEAEAPAPPAEGTEQIEASVTPEAPAAPLAAAAAPVAPEPVTAPSAKAAPVEASIAEPAPQDQIQHAAMPQEAAEPTTVKATIPEPTMPEPTLPAPAPAKAAMAEPSVPVAQEIAAPAEAPAEIDIGRGYGFLDVSTGPDVTARLSGENVSSMILMTEPVAGQAAPAPVRPVAKTRPTPPAEPARLAPTKPKAQPKPVATAAAKPDASAEPKPAPKPEPSAKPADQATAAQQDGDAVPPDADNPDAIPAETAEATLVEPVPMTRRERRMLRKQQRDLGQGPDLPWLR